MTPGTGEGRGLRSALAILGVAAIYFAAGRLALLLAIPPGYATAVWPAAGVAWIAVLLYGYRVLPGVWLGSFLVNVETSLDPSSVSAALASCALPASIGLGALLQAGASAALTRRWVGYPNALERDATLAAFLAIGAPLGCLIGASWGVASLQAAGVISTSEWAYSWLTWWAGDAIGVLLVAPPALAWLGRPAAAWRPRRVALSVPLAVLLVAAVLLFVRLSGWEQERIERSFQARAQVLGHFVSKQMHRHLEVVHALQAHLGTLPEAGRSGFRSFVEPALARHPGIQALEWAPRVRGSERARVERAARRSGLDDYRIRERAPDGSLVPAGERAEYVPVLLAEPLAANQTVAGFDLASDPIRRVALERARDDGSLSVSDRIRLVQGRRDPFGFLVILPVYRDGPVPNSIEGRREGLRGYVLGVFRASALLEGTPAADGLALRLENDAAAERVLAALPPEAMESAADAAPGPPGALGPARIPIDVGGRSFALEVAPTAAFLSGARSLVAWAVLVGALLFVGLLSAFLLSVTGRAAEVRRVVEQRTAELRAARRELERSNRDLEQFAYAVSHDLQAPLRTVRGFLDLFQQESGAQLDEPSRHLIATASAGAEKMRQMIRDLLSYAKLGGASAKGESRIDAHAVLQSVLERLQAEVEATGARVSASPLPDLRGDPGQLAQVLQNLVSNGLKYRGREAPRIHVSGAREGDTARLSVSDNGIGFRPDQARRIFDVFRRLHGTDAFEGTGIGLALARRIVEQQGGRVWAESSEGEGSSFHFTWPLADPAQGPDQG